MATPTFGTNEIGNHILCVCDRVLYMHLHCVYLHKRSTHIENRDVRFRKCEKIVLCEEKR